MPLVLRSGRSLTIVTQYDIELFQKIEALTGQKMEEYPSEQEAVLLLLERVGEAQRISTMQVCLSANTEHFDLFVIQRLCYRSCMRQQSNCVWSAVTAHHVMTAHCAATMCPLHCLLCNTLPTAVGIAAVSENCRTLPPRSDNARAAVERRLS